MLPQRRQNDYEKETQSLSLAASSPAEPYETPANAENRAIFTAEEFPFGAIVKPLTDWFNANKRDLPWRHDPTPYRVWVSEIMLQQTRVEAARDYYLRFLSALPAVEDLAYCEEDKLMKLWEGLGYYSRARNMQKTAKIVTETYGGVFPSDEKPCARCRGSAITRWARSARSRSACLRPP